jgi:hypothetical protein
MSTELVAQALGLVGLSFVFLSWVQKERKNIFIFNIINLFFYTAHYFVLGGYIAAMMCVAVIVRNILFIRRDTQKVSNAWLYFFLLLAFLCIPVFWNGWLTIFPVSGVVLSTFAMWQVSTIRMRIFMFLSCLLWLPYVIDIHSWAGIASQLVGILGIIFGLFKSDLSLVKKPGN